MNNATFAFCLTAAAGLSTSVGGLFIFAADIVKKEILSISLGFSAGVMVYVSMVELLGTAAETLSSFYGTKPGTAFAGVAFFFGMFIISAIGSLVPQKENIYLAETEYNHADKRLRLLHTGILTALAIALHNFAEGLTVFVSAMHNPALAVPVVAAIAIHNIPEGIAVSMPIFYATRSRLKAFLYSFLSGITELIGALVGYFLLTPFLNEITCGILYAFVAGIMVFISFDELMPSALEYGGKRLAVGGVAAGMAVMAISLLLL